MCRKGLRTDTSIVIETAQCNSTHHVCMLIGYGAHAISPYMAFETCRQWRVAPRYCSGGFAELAWSLGFCSLLTALMTERGRSLQVRYLQWLRPSEDLLHLCRVAHSHCLP